MSEKIPIKFISMVPGLDKIPDVQPVPAKTFYPKWWKGVPFHSEMAELKDATTVKGCPALPDYFQQGFVLPMWADSTLEYDEETTMYRWDVGRAGVPYTWSMHGNDQFLDHVPDANFQGDKARFIFKADCPWRLITPPGYSTLQLPMFYHYNAEFSVLPGVIRTDSYHELNQQLLIHKPNEKIFIPRGTPLVHYIPFKREEYEIKVSPPTKEDLEYFEWKDLDLRSSKIGKLHYRKYWED